MASTSFSQRQSHHDLTQRQRPVLSRVISGKQSYIVLCDYSQTERIELVKKGVPAALLTTMANDMAVTRDLLYVWIGIPRATANRKVKEGDLLSQDESERALGIARLVGQVEKMIAESGDPKGFDAAKATAAWLEQPNAALGGKSPGTFMDTSDGRALISGLVAQMQSGAYA